MQFWIHPDGYLYSGDKIEGAREATQEELDSFLNPTPTPEETQAALTDAVQNHMDTKVQERGYDSILSASEYAGDDDPVFNAEGTACKKWKSIIWRTSINILAEVTAGTREIPTAEELIAELPELVWPE